MYPGLHLRLFKVRCNITDDQVFSRLIEGEARVRSKSTQVDVPVRVINEGEGLNFDLHNQLEYNYLITRGVNFPLDDAMKEVA